MCSHISVAERNRKAFYLLKQEAIVTDKRNTNTTAKITTTNHIFKDAFLKRQIFHALNLKKTKQCYKSGSNSIHLSQTLLNELAKGKQTRLCLLEQ